MTSLTVLNHEIHQVDNLYSLNDLHKASGGQNKHRPAFFVRNQEVKELAKNNDLSMNAAIVQLLRKGLKLQDTNINEMDIFMRHLKNLVTGMPVDETSTLLANMVNSWIENKKPTA